MADGASRIDDQYSPYSATNGNEDLLKVRMNAVFEHASNVEEEFETRYVGIRFISTTSLQEAINECHSFLDRLGEPIDSTDISLAFARSEMIRVKELLLSEETPKLLTMPKMTDPNRIKAMKIMSCLVNFHHYKRSLKLSFVCAKMIEMSMEYGCSEDTAFALAVFGSNMVGFLRDIDTGCSLARMALLLIPQARQNRNFILPSIVSVVYGFALLWKEPLQVRIHRSTEL